MSEATKTEPTIEAKAEAVLASLMALTDTTPGGVALVSVPSDGEYSKKEGYSNGGSGGRTWVISVPGGDAWDVVVEGLYQMLCTTRGREWLNRMWQSYFALGEALRQAGTEPPQPAEGA